MSIVPSTIKERNPIFIVYDNDFTAPKRIKKQYDEWCKDKKIKDLMEKPEIFGAVAAQNCFSTPYALLTRHEHREDFEKLRCIIADDILAQKNFKIYVIPGSTIVYFKKNLDSSFFDVNPFNDNGIIRCYKEIESVMKRICDLTGMIFSKTNETHLVRTNIDGPLPKERSLPVLNFVCKNSEKPISTLLKGNIKPITSNQIYTEVLSKTPESFPESLYDDYLKEIGCDSEIISSEGACIQLHSSVYNQFSATQMPKEKKIILDKHNESTIRAYLDSMYFEAETFKEKYMNSELPILLQLLALVLESNDLYLVDVCIQIIREKATSSDAEKIENINEKYQNIYVHKLCADLRDLSQFSNKL
ncbi:MAG TPA: hypothetical protein VGP47_01315 [Parachlamydiaceae bacterium]|nr:hypothetical protein [Parachlamydiaceae bacterium]